HFGILRRYRIDDRLVDFWRRKLSFACVAHWHRLYHAHLGHHDHLLSHLPNRLRDRVPWERHRLNPLLFLSSWRYRQYPALHHPKDHRKCTPDDYGFWSFIRFKSVRDAWPYLRPIDPILYRRIGKSLQ